MQPMQGIRVLEVAQFTYVPSAGAVLADWGADVIKVEHAQTGDAQRGLRVGGASTSSGSFAPIMDHANRAKRSIGLALEHPAALGALYRLAATSDVFLTNFLPEARQRLRIDVDDIRKHNENIVYVRGSAFGARGPEAPKGGYDASAFWARGGSAVGVTPPGTDGVLGMPAPAYGDTIGGLTIAGGIAAALFARERTGHAATVDVSLLSAGAYANALAIDISLITGEPWDPTLMGAGQHRVTNPLSGMMATKDGRLIALTMLQPGRYWADFTQRMGREDLAHDERFDTVEKLLVHAEEAAAIVQAEIGQLTFDDCVERFRPMEGQWAPVQNSVEVGADPQLRANGYIAQVVDADGIDRELVVNPVQFDEEPATTDRGPLFAEHTDELLHEVGYNDTEIIELKVDGAAT
jgi:crotonobetainyl-CoA:carnitine CoA-transferase CaiB-like acyl-CoA transferase